MSSDLKTYHRLKNKVALITGGAGGLGMAIAMKFARHGASVVIADLAEDGGEKVAREIRADGGRAVFSRLDVSSVDSWTRCVSEVETAFGGLGILVNNAGIVSRTRIRSIDIEEWQRVLAINLTGAMLGIQSVSELMRQTGSGSVVNIASTAGLIAYPGVAYAASKWGMRGLTKAAALDLLDYGIRVNTVHPTQVSDTSITNAASEAWVSATARIMPMGRQVSSDEVSDAVLFLGSDESSYINGTELVIDGGMTMLGVPYVRGVLEREFEKSQT